MEAAGSAYPATLSLDAPLQVARWRALVAWLLAIPHLVIGGVLNSVIEVLAVISWFAILFTGQLPEGIAGVQCMCLRYRARAYTYAGFLYEPYPPFSFTTTPEDPGDLSSLRVDYRLALEDRNRVTVFFRIFLVIPHVIVLAILVLAAAVCYLIGFFAVLITGGWPEGLRGFIVQVLRWGVRVEAYLWLLTDEYPPFQLS
jgi:hypothetical protein